MSDEPPPSLRLKPRVKPEADPAASGADAASAQPPKADEAGMKIRLRPKLAPEPEAEEPVEEVSPAPFPSEEEDASQTADPAAEAPPEAPDPPPAPADGPKFRLKPRGGDAAAGQVLPPPLPPGFEVPTGAEANTSNPIGTVQFDPASEMNIPTPVSPLYIPTVETEATESVRLDLSPPAPPPVPTPGYEEAPEYQVPRPRRGFQPKAGTIGLIAAAVFILGCGAFFVHRVVNQPSSARPVKTKSRIRSIPVVAEPSPTPAPAAPTPTLVVTDEPKPKPSVTNTVTTTIAPGISATSAGAVEAINASPAFRSWVAAARISGVFQGAEPRALINNRMIRAGSIADDALAITFERIDADTKTIVFKDRTGAEVSRRY